MYLCRNMFPSGNYAKSVSRNAHYVVAFKNLRDLLEMRNLLLRVFLTQWQEAQGTFRRVSEGPFVYMILD